MPSAGAVGVRGYTAEDILGPATSSSSEELLITEPALAPSKDLPSTEPALAPSTELSTTDLAFPTQSGVAASAATEDVDAVALQSLDTVADELSSTGCAASDVSRVLIRRSSLCLEQVRALRAKVRDGLVDIEMWNQAYQMWKDYASDIGYAGYKDSRIRILVQTRGREETPENRGETPAQKRERLWRSDFEAFINIATSAPTYDAVAQSFQDHFEQVQLMGVCATMAVAMSVFAQTMNPAHVTTEELRWTVYLCLPNHSMLRVVSLTSETFAVEYTCIRQLKPWPNVRSEISWKLRDGEQIEMELNELDISNRSLKLLLAMCERKCKNKHLGPADRRAAGAYDTDRSLIVQLARGPGESRPRPPR
jgi:hypothetical protein